MGSPIAKNHAQETTSAVFLYCIGMHLRYRLYDAQAPRLRCYVDR